MSIRIMLVDDHKILRDALKVILEKEHDIVLVGEASEVEQAIETAREVQPDIILMDIGFPTMSGIDATRTIISEMPKTKIIALSTYSDRRIVLQMLDAGASGYVVKSSGRDEFLRAIRTVSLGRTYLCPDASVVLIDSVRNKHAVETRQTEHIGRREREVLQLLADGHTSPEIGKLLHIATSTVEVHRRNIMRKLELHSVAELTKYAVRNGLTTS